MVVPEGAVTLEKKEVGSETGGVPPSYFTKYLTLQVAKLFFY